MNLDEYELETINPYGLHPLELKGVYDKSSLTNELVDRWIPYYECHKCGGQITANLPYRINM